MVSVRDTGKNLSQPLALSVPLLLSFPGQADEPRLRPRLATILTANSTSRNVKEFFAFNLAPLAMVLYQEQRLFLKNAVDVQSAFPEWKRTNISGILKAALSDETKIHELLVTETFNDITYDP